MGRTHFKMRKLENVAAEASLYILAYILKRAIALVGTTTLMATMQA